jgi:hypothetical protein
VNPSDLRYLFCKATYEYVVRYSRLKSGESALNSGDTSGESADMERIRQIWYEYDMYGMNPTDMG